jgi:hypothetical protein
LKLAHAIHDAPGILKRLNRRNEKYIAFIKAALLEHLKDDAVVGIWRLSDIFTKICDIIKGV